MKNAYSDEGVKTRLILAALDELSEHGTVDFSLRRVAISAQVSCAAPYRHFKSKDDLIAETAKYITSKWELLAKEISAANGVGTKDEIVELSLSAVKFWIANGNFRSLLMPESDSPLAKEMTAFDLPLNRATDAYFNSLGAPAAIREEARVRILALIYGTVLLVATGRASVDVSLASLEREVLNFL